MSTNKAVSALAAVRKYESGGMFWVFLHNRILTMLIIMAVFTASAMVTKRAYVQVCVSLGPLIKILVGYSNIHRSIPPDTLIDLPAGHYPCHLGSFMRCPVWGLL